MAVASSVAQGAAILGLKSFSFCLVWVCWVVLGKPLCWDPSGLLVGLWRELGAVRKHPEHLVEVGKCKLLGETRVLIGLQGSVTSLGSYI